MDLPRLNVITFMTEYKILTYFKPSFRCIFWILVINPILKGVVSSAVKATMYPYLYFYKIPIRLWISCANCWVSWRTALPLFSLPELQGPDSNPKILSWGRGRARTWAGGGASASLSVPKGALPGLRGSNFLCNPTPLVVLILRNKREAELFKFKWGFPRVEVLLTLRAKMGSTWGHRWVEALCAWLVRLSGSHLWLFIKPCVRRIYW